jgi:hypothetical protein
MGEMRNAYKILAGKPEGKKTCERHRNRWEGIRMDLGEIQLGDVEWIYLAEDKNQ